MTKTISVFLPFVLEVVFVCLFLIRKAEVIYCYRACVVIAGSSFTGNLARLKLLDSLHRCTVFGSTFKTGRC